MKEFVTTFKFKASILFAIISFLVVMIAGLLKDVRFITIAWRSLLAFFVAGAIAYFIIFLLEFKGIINFDVIEAEEEIAEIDEETDENVENEETGEENGEKSEDSENEGDGFKPMNADNLQRVATS